MEKRFHDPCPERGIGEEDMLATVCRGTCVANPPTPVHMHQEHGYHGSHSLYSFEGGHVTLFRHVQRLT